MTINIKWNLSVYNHYLESHGRVEETNETMLDIIQ